MIVDAELNYELIYMVAAADVHALGVSIGGASYEIDAAFSRTGLLARAAAAVSFLAYY